MKPATRRWATVRRGHSRVSARSSCGKGIKLRELWGIIVPAAGRLSAAVFQRSVLMPGQVGEVAPDFKLPSPEHGDITLSQYHGDKTVVLSFHVFDFTSG